MTIAIIGWGSLIWCPGELRISSLWHKDGPLLPIEFSRVSDDGRLTLVIVEGIKPVQTLWAISEFNDIKKAVVNLQKCEDTIMSRIGQVMWNNDYEDPIKKQIKYWLIEKSLKSAIYTALPPRNPDDTEGLMTGNEALTYIKKLSKEKRKKAEEYVRNTPEQIETEIRERLRSKFGWNNNPLSQKLFE